MSDELDARLKVLEVTAQSEREARIANQRRIDAHERALFGEVVSDEKGMRRTPGLFDRMTDLTDALTQLLSIIRWTVGVLGSIATVVTLSIVGPIFVDWLLHHQVMVAPVTTHYHN